MYAFRPPTFIITILSIYFLHQSIQNTISLVFEYRSTVYNAPLAVQLHTGSALDPCKLLVKFALTHTQNDDECKEQQSACSIQSFAESAFGFLPPSHFSHVTAEMSALGTQVQHVSTVWCVTG